MFGWLGESGKDSNESQARFWRVDCFIGYHHTHKISGSQRPFWTQSFPLYGLVNYQNVGNNFFGAFPICNMYERMASLSSTGIQHTHTLQYNISHYYMSQKYIGNVLKLTGCLELSTSVGPLMIPLGSCPQLSCTTRWHSPTNSLSCNTLIFSQVLRHSLK